MAEEVVTLDVQGQVREIDVSKISPNPFQPREHFDETRIKELADSIRVRGLQQPVIVRPLDEDGTYELIVGERRLRAFKLLGRGAIPAIIRAATDEESQELALIENLQRDDLTPMEEARSLKELVDRSESVQAAARKVGRSPVHVLDRIALLNLPAEVQAMVHTRSINTHQAREILEIEGSANQVKAAQLAEKMNLSAIQIRGRFQRFMKKGSKKKDNGKSSGGVVKFGQVSAGLVKVYEVLDPERGFRFEALRDANKRQSVRNQLELVVEAATRALERLNEPVHDVAELIATGASRDGSGDE